MVDAFGTFTQAIIAAGLQPVREKKSKKHKLVLNRDLTTELQKYKAEPCVDVLSRRPMWRSDFKRTAVIGDTHFPFVHVDCMTAFYEFLERHKPERVVQIGDLYDMFSHGKFPRSMNVYTPEQEYRVGRKMAEDMWRTIGGIAPNAERFQLFGNHDARPLKRLMESYPEGEMWFDIKPAMQFDGVTTQSDFRNEIVFDNFYLHHGYLSSPGAHRDATLMNAVVGHSHMGGVFYRNSRFGILWELNAGYMGDPHAKALSYTPQKMTRWTHGWGYIDEYGPRFCALNSIMG